MQATDVNVKLAAGTGIAGLSIEDSTGNALHPLHDFDLAVERVRAARRAIDDSGTGIVLTVRSEGFVCRTSRHRGDDPRSSRLRGRGHWAYGGSAWGARWRAPPGRGSFKRRTTSPTRGRSLTSSDYGTLTPSCATASSDRAPDRWPGSQATLAPGEIQARTNNAGDGLGGPTRPPPRNRSRLSRLPNRWAGRSERRVAER